MPTRSRSVVGSGEVRTRREPAVATSDANAASSPGAPTSDRGESRLRGQRLQNGGGAIGEPPPALPARADERGDERPPDRAKSASTRASSSGLSRRPNSIGTSGTPSRSAKARYCRNLLDQWRCGGIEFGVEEPVPFFAVRAVKAEAPHGATGGLATPLFRWRCRSRTGRSGLGGPRAGTRRKARAPRSRRNTSRWSMRWVAIEQRCRESAPPPRPGAHSGRPRRRRMASGMARTTSPIAPSSRMRIRAR